MKGSFFANNRRALVEKIDPEGLYIFRAYDALQRSHDMAHSFTQESNFWYLTGIDEPGWSLFVDGMTKESWLVAPERDDMHILFDGGMTLDQARKISGADNVLSAVDGKTLLEEYKNAKRHIYSLGADPYGQHYNFIQNPAPMRLWNRLAEDFSRVDDTRHVLARLRAVKQPEEIALMRRAIDTTSDAFNYVKNTLASYNYESEVEAEFSYYFRKHGAKGHAYEPIVASGAHACTLHYGQNNSKLAPGSLLLLDIGASVSGYSADITRTYSIGEASPRAVKIHDAVSRAQREIIEMIRPGVSVAAYHEAVDRRMKHALMEVGLMSALDDSKAYRRYFPHAISHGLGIDVHDSLGGATEFESGMVLTVEPGIYIPEEGIGVRLEDDILVTKDGHDNMSGSLSLDL